MPASKKRFRAVLFDLDGTLVEFKFKVKESRTALIQYLERSGVDVRKLTTDMRTQDLIDASEAMFKESAARKGKLGKFSEIKAEIFRILNEFEFDALSQSRPHQGALPVLRKLKEDQFVTGLVTNSGRAPVDSVLSDYGLAPYLSVVLTRDEVPKLKPDPSGLQLAAKKLGVSTREAVYVGDSVIDIEASRRAGIKCVAVASGFYKSDVLKNASPDYLLERIEQLEEVVLLNR